MSDAIARALAAVEAAQEADPEGKELAYGRSVLRWVVQLRPDADALLQLCARAQHLERWAIPRSEFPMDRPGYHRWRTTLAHRQGDRLAAICREAGLDEEQATRAGQLVAKRIPRSDPDAQVLEDGACLVFLAEQFDGFADKQSDKIITIIQKTWAKMSPAAQQAALSLPLSDQATALVTEALG